MNIGIIGGADGPTSIYIASSGNLYALVAVVIAVCIAVVLILLRIKKKKK